MSELTPKQERARLKKIANKKPTKFIVLTFVGLGLFIGGIILAGVGGAMMGMHSDKAEAFIAMPVIGGISIMVGIVLFLVGLPSWITTSARYRSANKKLGK